MGDTQIKVSDYLKPDDVDAVRRVCNLLDACAEKVGMHGPFLKGPLAAGAYKMTAVMLRDHALPELAAEKKD